MKRTLLVAALLFAACGSSRPHQAPEPKTGFDAEVTSLFATYKTWRSQYNADQHDVALKTLDTMESKINGMRSRYPNWVAGGNTAIFLLERGRGLTYHDMKQYETALTHYEKMMAVLGAVNRSDQAKAFGFRGATFLLMGRWAEGASDYKRAAELTDNAVKREKYLKLAAVADKKAGRPSALWS